MLIHSRALEKAISFLAQSLFVRAIIYSMIALTKNIYQKITHTGHMKLQQNRQNWQLILQCFCDGRAETAGQLSRENMRSLTRIRR